MTSYFNLLKYAATGIASPDMTYYDKLRASTLMGGVVQTLTGQPPMTFKADGTPLISLSMKGNGSQQGTPTPSAPIQPEFVGTKTANIFYSDRTMQNTTASSTIDQTEGSSEFVISKSVTSTAVALSVTINLPLRAGTYTVSIDGLSVIAGNLDRINLRDSGGVVVNNVMTGSPQSFTISADTVVNAVVFVCDSTSTYTNKKIRIMLNSGSTALPYEPYGWAEKITCAGQTTPVYLGQTQTVRRVRKLVLTGEENWSGYSSAASGIGASLLLSDILSNSRDNGFCTHFSPQYSPSQSTIDGITFGAGNRAIYITFSAASASALNITDTASFKAFLAAQYAAGHPVTVWYALDTPETAVVNEPLAKIGTYADELSSEDAGVSIPTAKGQNTLTVDTPIQPSEMTITYKG